MLKTSATSVNGPTSFPPRERERPCDRSAPLFRPSSFYCCLSPAGAGVPAQAEHAICTEPLAQTTVTFDEAWQYGTDDDPVVLGRRRRYAWARRGRSTSSTAQLSQVVVLSPDGEFMETIGREGEGPGEFRGATDMVVWPDGRVLVECVGLPGKMVCFAADGTPVDDFIPVGSSEGLPMYLRVQPAPSGAIVLCGGTTAMEGVT